MDDENLVKVSFDLENEPEEISHDLGAEWMWVEYVGDERFKVRNSPFFFPHVSLGDIVEIEIADDGTYQFPQFVRVVELGGHSTVRLNLLSDRNLESYKKEWQGLKRNNCSYESSGGDRLDLYSLNVGPDGDYSEVKRILDDGVNRGIWEYVELNIEH